jgi:hypothetical protein
MHAPSGFEILTRARRFRNNCQYSHRTTSWIIGVRLPTGARVFMFFRCVEVGSWASNPIVAGAWSPSSTEAKVWSYVSTPSRLHGVVLGEEYGQLYFYAITFEKDKMVGQTLHHDSAFSHRVLSVMWRFLKVNTGVGIRIVVVPTYPINILLPASGCRIEAICSSRKMVTQLRNYVVS